MKKTMKFLLLLSLTFSILISPISTYSSDIHLLRNFENIFELPHNFRKTSDEINNIVSKKINLTGLKNLNISGSGQFSENSLSTIKKNIDNDLPITVVDLREESHGFINGIAISFENKLNNANKGLNLSEVLNTEVNMLNSIELKVPVKFYNDNNTVIPEKVSNESCITSEFDLNYLRIPVTDGHIPNNVMVNYFIEFVENLSTNTWLHFHCKEGIGRTTTFMIMYDIMKNFNEVSLEDIINRQVLISNMKETDTKNFYSGEKYNFLKDFYNTYREKTMPTLSINNSYIKNPIVPKFLYVISSDNMTKDEETMIATLQGIVSSKSNKQIYILSSNEPDYKIWLEDLNKNYSVKYKVIQDPWKLLNKFKSYVDGYVLYNSVNPASINNACSLASLRNSITINEPLESKVKNCGIETLTGDCRNTDKNWAYNNLWNYGLNHTTVIQLDPNKSMALRDYAIMSKSLVFYEDEINNLTLRKSIFENMNIGGNCLGWGPDEHTNVSLASEYGIDIIPSDWTYNLSVLSSFNSMSYSQNLNKEIPNEQNVHYITFIVSDGDNQQWFLGNNYSSNNWYGSPYRGNFNLGWSISPSIYYLAPTVFNKYYLSASSKKYYDNFLVPPSGTGYIYPSKFPLDYLKKYTEKLNSYMEKVDTNYVLILDDDALYKKNVWDEYTMQPNINGLFYLNYNKHNSYEGKIVWSNNKPVVSCRDLLWGGIEDETELISNINNRIHLNYTNITDPNSYTFVYVHAWSNSMDNLENLICKLNQNPKVRVITPDIFMALIKENLSSM